LIQLEEWQNNPTDIPKVTWLSGLVNPQSFLTAICQVAAQKNQWELGNFIVGCSVISVAFIICVVNFFTYPLLAGLRFTCRE
jgi:hypothetical protein